MSNPSLDTVWSQPRQPVERRALDDFLARSEIKDRLIELLVGPTPRENDLLDYLREEFASQVAHQVRLDEIDSEIEATLVKRGEDEVAAPSGDREAVIVEVFEADDAEFDALLAEIDAKRGQVDEEAERAEVKALLARIAHDDTATVKN